MTRRRYKNDLTTLRAYKRLTVHVRKLAGPMTTTELQAKAGLQNDAHGARGALMMLEVLGHTHAMRGTGKSFVWHPGARTSPRPEGLRSLRPFEQIHRLLKEYGKTRIATDELIRRAALNPEKSQDRRAVLGALKALVAMGLVECKKYDQQALTWYWADAKIAYEYDDGQPLTVSLDQVIYEDDDGSQTILYDTLSDENVRRIGSGPAI